MQQREHNSSTQFKTLWQQQINPTTVWGSINALLSTPQRAAGTKRVAVVSSGGGLVAQILLHVLARTQGAAQVAGTGRVSAVLVQRPVEAPAQIVFGPALQVAQHHPLASRLDGTFFILSTTYTRKRKTS